jgi:uncharacterized membrane protein
MILFIALVAVAAHLAPQLAGRDIFFGVTVAPGFHESPIGRRLARRYAAEIWLLAAAAAAFVVTSPMPPVSGGVLAIQAIGASVAFARAWNEVRPHGVAPATIREAAIGPREQLPGGLFVQIGPFLILSAVVVYVALNWEQVPARFPTHWNLAGKADGWTAKSVAGVFRGPAIGILACTMFWFTSYSIVHWSRLPRVTGPEGDRQRRVRRINLVALLASAYLIALLLSWTTVVAMFAENPGALRLPLPIRVAPFALLIVGSVAVRVMRRTAMLGHHPIGDATPDASWFLGRLYVNRQDPALFVQRRMGLGYTLNLGNPWSWLVMSVYGAAITILLIVA